MSEARTPEDAVAAARRRLRERIAAGEYADAERIAALTDGERNSLARLHDWAFIDVDPKVAYSTRRLGAPMTGIKQLLLRWLRQYHNELIGQLVRFNAHLLGYVGALEARLEEAERRIAELEGDKGET